VERGYYGAQVEHLLSLFRREQLLVLQAEQLRTDPAEALRRLSAFLGGPPPPPTAPRVVHAGVEMGGPPATEVAYLAGLYRRDQARLAGLLRETA
jgi:hypothetical protein